MVYFGFLCSRLIVEMGVVVSDVLWRVMWALSLWQAVRADKHVDVAALMEKRWFYASVR